MNASHGISLKHVRAFLAVAHLGNFSRAAERLSLTQPALTMCIKQLEELAGISLFDRTTRSVRLTSAGAHFLPIAERLIHDLDVAIGSISALAEGNVGHVSICAIPSVATHWLPPIIAAFARDFPNVRLRVEEGNSRRVAHQVWGGEADFGIATQAQDDAELHFNPIVKDPIGLVCLRNHPLAQLNRALSWRDLDGYTVLRRGDESWFKTLVENVANLASRMEASRYNVSNIEILVAMIRVGLGVTVRPAISFPRFQSLDPELVFLSLTHPKLERKIAVVERQNRTLSPAAQSLLGRITHLAGTLESTRHLGATPHAVTQEGSGNP
jgi:LysR family transcriptional regulator, carnitine catabolism transcriptional activator